MQFIGSITVRDQEFEVRHDPENALSAYSATVDKEVLRSKTYDGLRTKISAELRKADIQVSIAFMDPSSGRTGQAVGIHYGNGRVQVIWDDTGRKEAIDLTQTPLDPDKADAATLKGLKQAARSASEALYNYEREAHLYGHHSLKQVVEAAQQQAAERAEAESVGTTEVP